MRMLNMFCSKPSIVAAAIGFALIVASVDILHSKGADSSVIAASGVVTGNVQQVGFRAMIQKRAIQYNLAGSAENKDKTVHFTLQGARERVDEVLKAIRKGTKKSSDVNVSVSSTDADSALKTFTVFGWTSVSRHNNLVFELRADDSIISKDAAKEIWLEICRKTVKGEDVGKCDKGDD
jgi:acylphosphatase